MEENYILNGQGFGSVAQRLMACDFDPGALRPWIGKDGRSYITRTTINNQGEPVRKPMLVANTEYTLPYRAWVQLDQAIVKAAKAELRVWKDIVGAGLTYDIMNGMATTVLQYQNMSDISAATLSMDGLKKSDRDRPVFDLTNLPLPIISKDFSFPLRELSQSRKTGAPLDTSMAEEAARRCIEIVEQLMLGTYAVTPYYGGGYLYGMTNFPSRNTKTFTAPTASGWTPATLIAELLAAILQLREDYHGGPFILYNGRNWGPYLGDDYSAAKGDNTLRDRVKRIEEISDVRTSDYLGANDLVLVEQKSTTIQGITAMPLTTVQWPSEGGLLLNWKVMCIMVPRVRADYNGNCGILHGTV